MDGGSNPHRLPTQIILVLYLIGMVASLNPFASQSILNWFANSIKLAEKKSVFQNLLMKHSLYTKDEEKILNIIYDHCQSHSCCMACKEDECILFRIEKVITKEEENSNAK